MLDVTNVRVKVSALLKQHEDLQSDCSILRGEFYQDTKYGSDICYIKWFKKTPFDELTPFYKVDDEIRKMEKDLKRMEVQLAGGASYASIFDDFITIELRLPELEANHKRTIESLKQLRKKCEAVAPNPQYDPPYYEYEADVHFELIGNKPKPAGYTRPKAKALKHAHFRKAHDLVYLAQRTKEIEAEEKETDSPVYVSRYGYFDKAFPPTAGSKRAHGGDDSGDESPLFISSKRVNRGVDNGEGPSSGVGDKSATHPFSNIKLTTSTTMTAGPSNTAVSPSNDDPFSAIKGFRAESGGSRRSSRVKIAKGNKSTKSKKGKEPAVLTLSDDDDDQQTPPSLRINTSVKGKEPVTESSPVLPSPLDLDNPLSFPPNMEEQLKKLAMAHRINKLVYSEAEHEIKKKIFENEIESAEREKQQLNDDCKSLRKEIERLREEKKILEAEVKEVKEGLDKSLGLDM